MPLPCLTIRYILSTGRCLCVLLSFLVLPLARSAEAGTSSREPAGETVILPPFLVDSDAASWTLARSDNLEVLSLLKPTETREFAAGFLRARDAFDLIVPPEFQTRPSEPLTIILWDRHQRRTVPEETLRQYWPPGSFSRALPNLLVSDLNQWTLFCTPGPTPLSGRISFHLTPEFTQLLLASHKPAPAAWAMEALAMVCENARDTDGQLMLRIPSTGWKPSTGPDGVPPLAELLAEESGRGEPNERRAFGRQLFAVWALLPGNAQRTAAFWDFVRRTSAEPTTEAVFTECFGFGYEDADKMLLTLKTTWRGDRAVALPFPDREHSIQLEAPYPQVIARIKGNWMRLAASLIGKEQPALSAAYRSEGRHSVARVLSQSNPEPELLRVLALLAQDEGKGEEAREMLERVYRSGVNSTTVGVALSRLRLAAMKEPLDGAQLDSALEPLWQCCHADSPPLEAVQLAAKILGMPAASPRQTDIVQLVRWTKLFPRRPPLLFDVAQIALRHGYPADARELLKMALRHTTLPEARKQIEELVNLIPL